MMKQDPSLMHPAEVIQDLRHHLQAMENALQQISQGADHLINNLNQAEAALEGLDRQIGEISGFLSKANPSDPPADSARAREAAFDTGGAGSEPDRRGRPAAGRGCAQLDPGADRTG
jgi:hypothetical protein